VEENSQEIRKLTNFAHWRHVPGIESDRLPSRGCNVRQ